MASIVTHPQDLTTNVLFRLIKSSHSPSIYLSLDNPNTAATRANLRSGHRLNAWRAKVNIIANAECVQCKQPETTDHVIAHCPAYSTARSIVTLHFNQRSIDFNTAAVLGND